MIKTLRIAMTALFMTSMFCMASSASCNVNCAPDCGPCPTPSALSAACAPEKATIAACTTCKQPSSSGTYYPCDPSLVPCGAQNGSRQGRGCGNGGCNGMVGSCERNAVRQPSINDHCYRNLKTYRTCDDCSVDLVQTAPEFATVGSPYPITICITARKECAQVKVDQLLPVDSVFVASQPPAQPDENYHLQWEFPHMVQGETQTITVWVKPQSEGCCLAEATICACPQLCSYTRCGQPVVCIKKCGPACACLYCPITYTIQVSNSGSATAYDVVVTDTIPEGLTHKSGYNCLTYELGALAPGECRTINLDLCASLPGTVTNTACVTYCGGPKCCAEATTVINKPCVEVTKTGPDWAYICKTVDYTITVTNPGDLVLRNVRVEDTAGAGTVIVDAPGAEVCCNRAVWCIPELCPGETKTLIATVRSQVPGCIPNKVNVTSQSDCGTCSKCAEATTCWKGLPAVHMCMVDTCDPICVGETTVYRICVTNRGTADDTNVRLSLTFTNELQPQSINGPTKGTINGQTVTFDPVPVLGAKQSVEYCISVKGVSAGNARADATLQSDSMPEADKDSESTHVY